MAFLGQINMNDVKALLGQSLLPESGMLYFFSAFGWGEDHSDDLDHDDPANTRVIYYDGPLNLADLKRHWSPKGMPPIGKWGQDAYSYTKLRFVSQLSLPSLEDLPNLPEDVSPELYDKIHYDFNFLTNDHFRHVPQHQLLGYMWSIQGLSMDDDETLLIQFDTDYWEAGFQWGDGGMLYFSLPKTDLQKRDFSHCRCNYESG